MKARKGNLKGEVSKLDTSLKHITDIIVSIKKDGKKRNFSQSIDAGINLTGINFKQTLNRIGLDVVLPHPFRKAPKVLLFGSTPNFINSVKDVFDKVVVEEQVPNFDKKTAKKLAKDYDLFFSEPKTLPLVGKYLGQTLAPRGKMPKPCPPNVNAIKVFINNFIKTVKIANKKGSAMPVLHFPIGKEDMPDKDVAENYIACYTKLLPVLPGKTQNIKSMYLKTTMGSPKYIFKR